MMLCSKNRELRCIVLFIGSVGACSPSPAAQQAPTPPRQPRFGVSLQRARIYLGELLETLSTASGSPHRLHKDSEWAGGIDLSVFLTRRDPAEVRAALEKVLETKANRVEWREVKGSRGYTLVFQRTPAEAYARAREPILNQFAQDVVHVHATFSAPPAQRAARIASRPDLYGSGLLTDRGLGVVLGALNEAELGALLRGERLSWDPQSRTPGLPASALSFGQSGGASPAGAAPLPRQKPSAGLYVTWDSAAFGPILWMRNSEGAATNLVGGTNWDAAWMERNGDGWLHEREPGVYALAVQHAERKVHGKPILQGTVYDCFDQIARSHQVDLIADAVFPRRGATYGGLWLARTPEESLKLAVFRLGLHYRKESGIHILRGSLAEIHPRSHLLPWSDIKALRTASTENGGFLGLKDLSWTLRFRTEQINAQSEEFPDLQEPIIGTWAPIIRFSALLDASARKALSADRGLALREAGQVARAALADGPDHNNIRGLKLMESGGPDTRVWLREERASTAARTPSGGAVPAEVRRLVWTVRAPDGTEHSRAFTHKPRKTLRPAPDEEPAPPVKPGT